MGAAATSADTGQATSEDQAVDKIASLAEQTDLHVAEGSDATLPQTVAATYESGATKQENVTWKLNGADAPATLAQLPAGSYEFEGTVDGATQTVKQRVVIEAAAADPAAVNAVEPVSSNEDLKIASVDSTPIVKKYVGQGYVGEEYGTSVNLTLTNGTKATGMVNWDKPQGTLSRLLPMNRRCRSKAPFRISTSVTWVIRLVSPIPLPERSRFLFPGLRITHKA